MKIFRLFVIIIICALTLLPTSSGVAFADNGTLQGSDVLEDLSKDTSFRQSDYPVDESKNTLSIITIAESWNKELLIYVYQPAVSKNYRANYISMSIKINDSIDPSIYKLTFCNSNGTLHKYVVDNFTVKDDDVRYYEIYSIFRPFDETVDKAADNDNTINSVPFGVSKSWKFGTINGNSYVDCVDVKTIDVTAKYVGFVRYENSDEYNRWTWMTGYDKPIDSHFVAFDTAFPIENLLEAKVYYSQQFISWHRDYFPDGVFEDVEKKEVTVNSTDKASFTSEGWYNYGHFEWNRIQKVEEFISGEDSTKLYEGALFNTTKYSQISEESREYLSSCKWVLRFTETEHTEFENLAGDLYSWNRFAVGNVTILRLKFVTAGVTYNLGVVDNMQTGSSIPSNITGTKIELSEGFSDFLQILLIIVGAVILIALLPVVLKVVSVVCKILFAPFRWLFGSKKKRR